MTYSVIPMINDAISLATIDGNFNSDLIANEELKRLCILAYTNKICSENPDSVLAPYQVSDSFIASEYAKSSLNVN
jgi:hypothetical protein